MNQDKRCCRYFAAAGALQTAGNRSLLAFVAPARFQSDFAQVAQTARNRFETSRGRNNGVRRNRNTLDARDAAPVT